ncbi:MAG TPA: lipoprotein [Burkholderiaceae bacterium]|nr:lipoprotein [Burkholderiaceae bacterium]
MRFAATILAGAMLFVLSACGQKGPLTLPPPSSAQTKAPAKSVDRPFPDVPATSEQK